MEPPVRVFGYARVSAEEQSAHADSLETQRQQIVGYAMMKGWQVAEIFVERGVAGSIPLAERPQGARLLETVAKGDAIVTPKLDHGLARYSGRSTGRISRRRAL